VAGAGTGSGRGCAGWFGSAVWPPPAAGHARRRLGAALAAQDHEQAHKDGQGDACGDEKDDELGLRHDGP